MDPGCLPVLAPTSLCALGERGWIGTRAPLRPSAQLRIAAAPRGESVIYVARQLGHDARLTLTRYGHVIDELEDLPRLEAEEAIASARHPARLLRVGAVPKSHS